ncbi:MFS Git1p-related glycerophosphoinositol permease [Endogone sp. FLAS-F59071]|nr:MFS Git1p-related glycerophosphoinositol permease [Endogone sp. FLAS-F59071]|eukprot:RUS19305.1 MFS Git1p-related glycerophosphoinositol permease [Endogone sp. FLAS-F59071]
MESTDEKVEAKRSKAISPSHKPSLFFNIKTVIVAGFALISSGYQSNVFNLNNLFFTRIYGSNVFTSDVSARIGNALFVGSIVGQLGFGVFVDRFGRKTGLLLTTFLIVIGTGLCASAYGVGGSSQGLFWALTIYRGITGVGTWNPDVEICKQDNFELLLDYISGGEYPCSSIAASEASDEVVSSARGGGVLVMATNFVIVLGGIVAVCVNLLLLTTLGENKLELIWRMSFGIGIIFPLSLFYFRLRLPNSRLYNAEAIRSHVPYGLALSIYWRNLIGSAGCWFLYDFITYPNSIVSSTIISTIVPDNNLMKTSEYQLLLQLLSLPGVVLGAWAVDKIGRRKTMALGFLVTGIFGIIIGLAYEVIKSQPVLFVILYAFFLSGANFGPGDCVHLISTEIYPTALRGTFYGLSAAVGKTGASVGIQILVPLQESFTGDMGNRVIFWVCSAIAFIGVALCLAFIPEYSTHSLEDEDLYWRHYLREHGWNREIGIGNRTRTRWSMLEMQLEA